MSVVRIVTRIVPSAVQPESYSHLLEANEIDTPLNTEWSHSGDPSTGNTFLAETTFCQENRIEPDVVDIDGAIASKCNAIAGLVCLKKSRLRLTSEAPVRESLIRICPETLDDGTCGGILLSIPLRISRSDISYSGRPREELANSGIWHQQTLQLNPSGTGRSLAGVQSCTVPGNPLEKYFQNNKCLLCDFAFTPQSERDVKRHLATHLPVHNFQQDIYKSSMGSPSVRKKSPKQSHRLPLPCKQCHKRFDSKQKLNAHTKTHHPETIKCPCCDTRLKGYRALKAHIRCTHPGQLPYHCTDCPERFRTLKTLHEHSLLHSKKQLLCDGCGREFDSQGGCPCGSKTRLKGCRGRFAQTGWLPYPCTRCPERFRTLKTLRQHSLQHNKKQFLCDICGKGFNSQNVFRQHSKMHSQKDSFQCRLCKKVFNYKANLAKHMRNHTRKHFCDVCGMGFKFLQHLKNHTVKFHHQPTDA